MCKLSLVTVGIVRLTLFFGGTMPFQVTDLLLCVMSLKCYSRGFIYTQVTVYCCAL